MMKSLVLLVVAAIAAIATMYGPAEACSVGSTFMPPTNVELVASTPAIVVARATAENGRQVELTVTRVIKGALKIGDSVRVNGSTQRYFGASKPDDFSRARKGAYAGSCTAWDYKRGKHFLLFLEHARGDWRTRGVPFTRVNEEVDAGGDPWTTAVIAYTRFAGLPAAARQQALAALVARGTRANATAADKAIAADVQHHLATPTPFKSFAELDAMYRVATPDQRHRIALAIGVGGDRAARAFMKNLVAAVRAGTSTIDRRIALDAIAAYYVKVSDPPVLSQIAELYVALGTKTKQERWDLMWLLIKRADARQQHAMERALAGADDEEAGRLVEWFAKSPSAVALRDVKRRVGRDYAKKWQLAIGLAALGDPGVLAWAKQQLAAPVHDDRWIALYAIAVSPRADADALVPGIIARGGEDLESLIQGYEKAHHLRVDVRLRELAARKLEPEARKWLDRTQKARASAP